jgi:hypothetical protein
LNYSHQQPDEDKLVTSVAIPAFDLKYNKDHNDAMLLGVAGTDVPIDSIAKLAQPHQVIKKTLILNNILISLASDKKCTK